MKKSIQTIVLILALLLSACDGQPAIPVETHPAPFLTGSVTDTADATEPQPTITIERSPTPDLKMIIPFNAQPTRLMQRIGMGNLLAAPLYSPNGAQAVIATTTGVYLYEPGEASALRLLTQYTRKHFAFSPDGKTLAIGSRLFAIIDGRELLTLIEPTELTETHAAVWDVVFSPDGKTIAVGYIRDSGQSETALYSLEDGSLLQRMEGHKIAFSPDSRYLIVTPILDYQPDGQFSVYQLTPVFRLCYQWRGKRGGMLPNGGVYIEVDGTVNIYDLESGDSVSSFDGQFAAFSSDGKILAALSLGQVTLYDVQTGRVTTRLDGEFPDFNGGKLLIAPEGRSIAGVLIQESCCGIRSGIFTLWDESGQVIKQISAEEYLLNGFFAFSPDGQTLLTAGLLEALEAWQAADGEVIFSLKGLTAPILNLVFLPDSRRIVSVVSGSLSGTLIYDVKNGQLQQIIPTGNTGADGLAVHPTGEVIGVSDHLWQISTGQILESLAISPEHPYVAFDMAFSSDGQFIVTGTLGGYVQIWDFQSLTRLAEVEDACAPDFLFPIASGLVFSPDGKSFAVSCTDASGTGSHSILVWTVGASPSLLHTFTADEVTLDQVAYSADGHFLVAAGSQGVVWSTSDGSRVATFNPNGTIISFALSPDGQLAALGMQNGTIELWETTLGRSKAILPGEEYNQVNALAFSPDGQLLAAGYMNGEIKVWER